MSDDSGAPTPPAADRFEGLGSFYLGTLQPGVSGAAGRADADEGGPFLYDAKDLTTHAVVLGMTGSGKTGLCITLLEEAALDGIPAIAVDLKGDIANLLLTFPELRPEDFRPWIDEAEASRKGRTPDEHAAAVAKMWREGLASTGQDGERIRRLRDAVDMAVYTPGGSHGRPLAVLRSFAAPSEAILADSDALGDKVMSAVSGLLALIGETGDPLNSRKHILLSRILHQAWTAGEDLDLAGLIHAVQDPGFERIGVMDMESFFNADDRFEFAAQLNNLVAAPGFEAWLQGEPLDIGSLLWTDAGKPRISIVSIAHLDEAERQFFLTMLLNETVAWVRSQPGTNSLRALLYIDEVFGYLPPTAVPPTKPPLLTLLKQARAFGFGVVLATQNPVDLDYKALSNAGTWFLGRLQTERDKLRVLDGLEGTEAMSGPGGLSRAELDNLLSDLDSRVFLVNNVHEDAPVVVRTRWAMSYLRGPLARPEIKRLVAERGAASGAGAGEPMPRKGRKRPGAAASARPGPAASVPTSPAEAARPMVPPKIDEVFIDNGTGPYRPALLGHAELHYTKASLDLDYWAEVHCLAGLASDIPADPWEGARLLEGAPDTEEEPEAGTGFASLPPGASDPTMYRSIAAKLKSWLYRERRLTLRTCKALKLTSRPDETEGEFALRLREAAREARDEAVDKLRDKYAAKVKRLEDRIDTAEDRVRREEAEYEQHRNQSLVTMGTSILGAMLGRKTISKTNIGKVSTAARGFGRASKHKDDVGRAGEKVATLEADLQALEVEMEEELAALREAWAPDALEIVEVEIPPRKADIDVKRVALAWVRE